MAKKFLKNADGSLRIDSKTGKPIVFEAATTGIDHAYFVQEREKVFSLYLLPIEIQGEVVEQVQNKEIVING